MYYDARRCKYYTHIYIDRYISLSIYIHILHITPLTYHFPLAVATCNVVSSKDRGQQSIWHLFCVPSTHHKVTWDLKSCTSPNRRPFKTIEPYGLLHSHHFNYIISYLVAYFKAQTIQSISTFKKKRRLLNIDSDNVWLKWHKVHIWIHIYIFEKWLLLQ